MSQTITKHIGEGFARGELYAALAYDTTDVFGGMRIKGLYIASPSTAVTGKSAIRVDSDFTGDGYHVPLWVTSRHTGDGATYGSIYAVRGHAEVEGTQSTQGNEQFICGVHGRVDNTGTIYNSGLIMSGMTAQVLPGGTYSAVSHLACLWATWQFTGAVSAGETELLYLCHNGAGHTLDSFIYIYGANATNYFMKFHNTMTGNWVDTGTTEGTECVGHLKVRFNNADAYINVFSDNS